METINESKNLKMQVSNLAVAFKKKKNAKLRKPCHT